MAPQSTPKNRQALGTTALEVVGVQAAKTLAHPLRLLILAELNEGPLSPSQFHERHPEWTLQAIAQQFAELAKLGCIELVEVRETGTSSRGRPEHIYRAIRRAIFSQDALEAIGRDSRHVTAATFQSFVRRVGEAIDAETFGARSDAHFSWIACRLDETGWSEVLPAVDALFLRGLDLHMEAVLRMRTSGEEGFVVTVAPSCMSADGSSVPPVSGITPEALTSRGDARSVDLGLAKALAHPIRIAIIAELLKGPTSPRAFCRNRPDVPLRQALYHFRVLEKLGRIELVERRSGRGRREGGVENIFRATKRSVFDGATYDALPPTLQAAIDEVTVVTYCEAVAAAIESDAIEDRADGHLTWTGLRYDEQAWREMIAATDAVLSHILEKQVAAEQRLAFRRADGIAVVAGLACFESPRTAAVTDLRKLHEINAEHSRPRRDRLGSLLSQIVQRSQRKDADGS